MEIFTFKDYLKSIENQQAIDFLGENRERRLLVLCRSYLLFLIARKNAATSIDEPVSSSDYILPYTALIEQLNIINAYYIHQIKDASLTRAAHMPALSAEAPEAELPIMLATEYPTFNTALIAAVKKTLAERSRLSTDNGVFMVSMTVGVAAAVAIGVEIPSLIIFVLTGLAAASFSYFLLSGIAEMIRIATDPQVIDPLVVTLSNEDKPTLEHRGSISVSDNALFKMKQHAMNAYLDQLEAQSVTCDKGIVPAIVKNVLTTHYRAKVYSSSANYDQLEGLLEPGCVSKNPPESIEIPHAPPFKKEGAQVNVTRLARQFGIRSA